MGPLPGVMKDAGTQGGLGDEAWGPIPGFGWEAGTPDASAPASSPDASADAATRACDPPQGTYLIVVDRIERGNPESICDKGDDNYRFTWPDITLMECRTRSRVFSADACSYREDMSCLDSAHRDWQCSLDAGASVIHCRMEQTFFHALCIIHLTITRVACPEGSHDVQDRCVPDCSVGHVWNGSACADQDECALGYCAAHGTCQNLPGTYNCVCDPGYAYEGTQCALKDPCAAKGLLCDENAACAGSSPSDAVCVCKDGYRGPGSTCDDIDECAKSPCEGVHQVCVNEPGFFACDCEREHRWNGTQCVPYNGCTIRGLRCHEAAACVEDDGGFTCACGADYEGDGGVCEPRARPAQ